jgi:hypothetical protein
MASPIITDFLFDVDNEEKVAAHGLRPWQVLHVLEGPHAVVPNKKAMRASHMVIGRDRGGRCITIPVEPTHDSTLWRPVTAWPCKDHERAVLDRTMAQR